MAVTTDPTPAQDRLARAGELAAFLRDNPKAARQDPETLAARFDLDAAVVAHLQLRARESSRDDRKVDWIGGFGAAIRRALSSTGRLLRLLTSQPYAFLVGAGLLTVGIGFLPGENGAFTTLAWLALMSCCLFYRPQFRHVLAASVVAWAVAWATLLPFASQPTMRTGVDQIGGPVAFAFCLGLALAFTNLLVGSVLLVIAGWVTILSERKAEAALSRQDLLSRMFSIQERLAQLPDKAKKPEPTAVAYARAHVVLVTAVAIFLFRSAGSIVNLLFHTDVRTVTSTTHAMGDGQTVKVVTLQPNLPPAYVMIQALLTIARRAVEVGIGFLTTSWRKFWLVCLAILGAQILATAWAWPAKGEGSLPLLALPVLVITYVIDSMVPILLVRFGVGFNRALRRYRAGEFEDEAALVSELLEIRRRLSAVSVQVYVLVVDAAGSTQMKRNADPLVVEYSFGRYQAWIGDTITQNGGKVDMRTGDGAICAFGDVNDALSAARDLQSGIAEFNAHVNRLDLPFRLRVALHAGKVVAELDKVQFNEVIDIAAHVEKYSPVGGIAMTEPFLSAARLAARDPLDLTPSASVDGLDVYTQTF